MPRVNAQWTVNGTARQPAAQHGLARVRKRQFVSIKKSACPKQNMPAHG